MEAIRFSTAALEEATPSHRGQAWTREKTAMAGRRQFPTFQKHRNCAKCVLPLNGGNAVCLITQQHVGNAFYRTPNIYFFLFYAHFFLRTQCLRWDTGLLKVAR